jgi:formimidoylglutamate deiminase
MKLYAKQVLTSEGWLNNKTLIIENGVITDIADGQLEESEVAQGPVIPGMVNCHSHAFQRGFAGFSEQGSEGQDSFWTWRKIMYKFLDQITAEQAQVIATQLYIEMVKAGYTRVAEFHYLHHQASGKAYDSLSEMSAAIFKASQSSGIGLTLLPVLYRFSGFGPLEPTDGQKRFINSTEQFNQLVSDCFEVSKGYANTNVGIAPHSLRAVDKASLTSAVNHVRSLDNKAPIHIHISEQIKEVDDCLAHYGQRPVEWLLNNVELDQHWCLIHATHINEQERRGIIKSGAIAGICPTTEANLGDGIFPTTEFVQEQGTFAIGSDSHISVNPVEELRWLEYAQRLSRQQRAILATSEQPSVGRFLWQQAAAGGAQSTSSNTGEIGVGKQADILVLAANKTPLFANSEQHLLDSMVFASQENMVSDVMVNGHWVVKGGEHPAQEQSAKDFAEVLAILSA